MMAKRKRAESRTRTVRMDGREWRVEELTDRDADDREIRALVFTTEGETLRVNNYHWLWFGFMDDELASLCRPRARSREPVAVS